jgi:hypothetical protein
VPVLIECFSSSSFSNVLLLKAEWGSGGGDKDMEAKFGQGI